MASIASPSGRTQTLTAAFLAIAMAAIVATVLGFEHIGGYIPCKLCYEQRVPYYIGIPLMVVGVVSATLRWPAWMTRGLLLVGGLLMVWSLFLGIRHAGVEWGWWAGPADCGVVTAPVDTGGKGVLDALNTFVPPACETAALRVLGLSFAGWNAVASIILAAIAFRGALSKG